MPKFSLNGTLHTNNASESLTFTRNSVAYVDGVQIPVDTAGYRGVAYANGYSFTNPGHGVTWRGANDSLVVGNKFDGLYYTTDGDTAVNFVDSTYNSDRLFVTSSGTVLVWTTDVPTSSSSATSLVLNRITNITSGSPTVTTSQLSGANFLLQPSVGLLDSWCYENSDGTLCMISYPTIAAVGGECKVYRSTDDGATWTLQYTHAQINAGENNHGHAITYMEDNDWWIASIGDIDNNRLVYSTDDGVTWTALWSYNQVGIQPVAMTPFNDGSGRLLCGADSTAGVYVVFLGDGYTAGTRPRIEIADVGWATHTVSGSAVTARFCWAIHIDTNGVIYAGHIDNTVTAAEDQVGERGLSISDTGEFWTTPIHFASDSAGLRTIFSINNCLIGSEGYDNSGSFGYRPYKITKGSIQSQQACLVAKGFDSSLVGYTSAQSEPTTGYNSFGSGTLSYSTAGDQYSGTSHVRIDSTVSGQMGIATPNITAAAGANYAITCALRGNWNKPEAQINARYNNATNTLLDIVPIGDNWMPHHFKIYNAAGALPLRAVAYATQVNPHPGGYTQFIAMDAVQIVRSDNPVEYMEGQVTRVGESLSYTATYASPARNWFTTFSLWPLYHSFKLSGKHTVFHLVPSDATFVGDSSSSSSYTDFIKLVYDADSDVWTLSTQTSETSSSSGVWFHSRSQFDIHIETNPATSTVTAIIGGAGGNTTLSLSNVSSEITSTDSVLTAYYGDKDVDNNMGMLVSNIEYSSRVGYTTLYPTGNNADRTSQIHDAIEHDPNKTVYLEAGTYHIGCLQIDIDDATIIMHPDVIIENHSSGTDLNGKTYGSTTAGSTYAPTYSSPFLSGNSHLATIVARQAKNVSIIGDVGGKDVSATYGPLIKADGVYSSIMADSAGLTKNFRVEGVRCTDFRYKGINLRATLDGNGIFNKKYSNYIDNVYVQTDRGYALDSSSSSSSGATEYDTLGITEGPLGIQVDPGSDSLGTLGMSYIGRVVFGDFPYGYSNGGGPTIKIAHGSFIIKGTSIESRLNAFNGYSVVFGENVETAVIENAYLPGGMAHFPDRDVVNYISEKIEIKSLTLRNCRIGHGANTITRSDTSFPSQILTLFNHARIRNLKAYDCIFDGIQRSAFEFNSSYSEIVSSSSSVLVYDDASVESWKFYTCKFISYAEQSILGSYDPQIIYSDGTRNLDGKIIFHECSKYGYRTADGMPWTDNATLNGYLVISSSSSSS